MLDIKSDFTISTPEMLQFPWERITKKNSSLPLILSNSNKENGLSLHAGISVHIQYKEAMIVVMLLVGSSENESTIILIQK